MKALSNRLRDVIALATLAGVLYISVRVFRIFGGWSCVVSDLYGGSQSECSNALREGHVDPLAPWVGGAVLLYAFGGLAFLLFYSAKDRDWKAVGLFLLIGLGWLALGVLESRR